MVEGSRSILFGGLLFGAALATLYLSWRRKKNNRPSFPSKAKWIKIGTLDKMLIYPMKSGGGSEIVEAECTELGPKHLPPNEGLFPLNDRNFIVYRQDTKEIMLCMTYPIMVSIKIQTRSGNSVLFMCRDKPHLRVTIPTPNKNNKGTFKAKMWTGEKINYLDCGDEAADWVTEVIKGDKEAEGKLRLGYWAYPHNWQRGVDENYDDRGAYQNYTSYMMMTSSSLEDLKERIPEQQIGYKQFRPNFLVDTIMKPYSEDNWTWIKIGEDAVFVKIKNCARCSQININPDTSKINSKHEPLKTLTKYRSTKNGPLMGICLGLYKTGKVKIGDTVYISQ